MLDIDEIIYQISLEQDTLDFVLIMIKNQLNDDGIEGYEYAESTIEAKKKKGQPYQYVTLKDEGDFQRSFTIVAEPTKFVLDSDSLKNDYDIYEKYDEDKVLFLNDKNKELLSEFYEEKLINRLNDRIQEYISDSNI